MEVKELGVVLNKPYVEITQSFPSHSPVSPHIVSYFLDQKNWRNIWKCCIFTPL